MDNKKLEDLHLPKKNMRKKLQKNVKQMGLVIEIFFRECGSVCVCVRVCDRAQAVV